MHELILCEVLRADKGESPPPYNEASDVLILFLIYVAQF